MEPMIVRFTKAHRAFIRRASKRRGKGTSEAQIVREGVEMMMRYENYKKVSQSKD